MPSSSSSSSSSKLHSRLLCVPEAAVAPPAASSSSYSSTSSTTAMHLGQVLALAHPRGGSPAQYLLTPSGYLCELQTYRPSGSKFGSWFVEQRVVSDGRLFVASPMDPKLLLLPMLERTATRYSPLEQILAAEGDGAYMPLKGCLRLELHRVCDENDQLGDDMILNRLNPDKALAWLAGKVERTKQALVALDSSREGQNNGIGSGFAAGFISQTTTTTKGSSNTTSSSQSAAAREPTREEARTAVELVCDYLNDEWARKLQDHCGFSAEDMKEVAAAAAKRRSAWENENDAEQDTALELTHGKRFKAGADAAAAAPAPKASGPSLAHKKLAKTNLKGVKSISSFFGKKS